MEVAYVFQDLQNIPEGFTVPEGRVKPWGTGHAVLSCIDIVDGPFEIDKRDITLRFRGSSNQHIYRKDTTGDWNKIE